MRSMKLTEEEVSLIENFRKEREIPESELDKMIKIYQKNYNSFKEIVTKLGEIVNSNEKAAQYIFSKIDSIEFNDWYDFLDIDEEDEE